MWAGRWGLLRGGCGTGLEEVRSGTCSCERSRKVYVRRGTDRAFGHLEKELRGTRVLSGDGLGPLETRSRRQRISARKAL